MPSPNSDIPFTVYIGLGGNVGDVVASMLSALEALDGHPHIKVVSKSSLYKTPPWGDQDQDDFINACAELETTLSPLELLKELKSQEEKLKRVKTRRWGPRTIDLDILTFGDVEIDDDGLQIPHPRMTERAFVILPLSELNGSVMIWGKSALEWLDQCDQTGIERLDDQKGWKRGRL